MSIQRENTNTRRIILITIIFFFLILHILLI